MKNTMEEASTKAKGKQKEPFFKDRSDNLSKRPKKKKKAKKGKKSRFKEGSVAGFLGKFYTKGGGNG